MAGLTLFGVLLSFAPASAGTTVVEGWGRVRDHNPEPPHEKEPCSNDPTGFIGYSPSGLTEDYAEWTFVGWRLSASACATVLPAVVAKGALECAPPPDTWCRVGGTGGTFTLWRVDATHWDFELCVLGGTCTRADGVPITRLPS